ncbi:MAG: DUF4132 domain-containing protein [Blastocatellia bacterium]|nr:DUF4132 domain-containing protein [Blastocatellia bacterium]
MLSDKFKDYFLEILRAKKLEPVTCRSLLRILEHGSSKQREAVLVKHLYWNDIRDVVLQLISHPDLKLIDLLKLLIMANVFSISEQNPYFFFNAEEYIREFRNHSRISLQDLSDALEELGGSSAFLAMLIFSKHTGWSKYNVLKWEKEALQSYFFNKLDYIFELLEGKVSHEVWYAELDKASMYKALELLPSLPENFLSRLWTLALLSSKNERIFAQKILDLHTETVPRLIAELQNKRTVLVAADWLARLGAEESIHSIKTLLQKEKSETVRDGLIRALEKLGEPIDSYFNRSDLLEEARKGLSVDGTKKLWWMDFDKLPEVYWQDSGEIVPKDVIKWLIMKSFKQKSVEPSPTLRRYTSYFRKTEKEKVGKFVLESWIAKDTMPAYTYEEALEKARQDATTMINYSYYSANFTLEALTERLLQSMLKECAGSATSEKGVLAFAAACCGASSVAVVAQYIKEWYGFRVAQCKALIQLLYWIDDSSSIQLLLSISSSFRTKSIQAEASKYIGLLMEAKGWSRDELADRSIPTLGFDKASAIVLDYGSRQFTVKLNSDFNFILTDSDGKVIKSLPNARKSDYTQKVDEAKKWLSQSKKQLKEILKLQRDRLYEGLCYQREWLYEDWWNYLYQHPFVSQYCQTLIWTVLENGEPKDYFRPLDDGSLTDVNDNEVKVAFDRKVKLAHPLLMSDSEVEAWQRHLADYEVVQVIEQFLKKPYKLSEKKKTIRELDDFQGYMLDAFQLRGRATKLGYLRGSVEDGGWFNHYKKAFVALGIEAVVEFTGNILPEVSRQVAIKTFYFIEHFPDTTYNLHNEKIYLKEIPPVILSEVYNDVRSIASQGSGYDPEWEKKTGMS